SAPYALSSATYALASATYAFPIGHLLTFEAALKCKYRPFEMVHANFVEAGVAHFAISLLSAPIFPRDSIYGHEYACAIAAVFAVHENRAVFLVIDKSEKAIHFASCRQYPIGQGHDVKIQTQILSQPALVANHVTAPAQANNRLDSQFLQLAELI